MYARSSFEHSPHPSSRPNFPPQSLLEFRFGSYLPIASPRSDPLPVPYHICTKSFSFYLTSPKSLAPLHQKTSGIRTACSISARPNTTVPTSPKSNPCVSYPPPSSNSFAYVSYEKIFSATSTIQLRGRFQIGTAPRPALPPFAIHAFTITVPTQQSLPFRAIDPSDPAP
jgi:hypothetical protein